jgi:hypothetical protein
MILTKEHQEAAINAYIKAGHNQDECIGFIDGFEKAMQLVKNCSTPAVSKCEGLQGRELLLAYTKFLAEGPLDTTYWLDEQDVENFLASNSC